MGVPTSEVGYTPAMPRREDHEVHKDMWWHWTKKNIKIRILGLAGHIIRLEEERIPKKVLNGNFYTTSPVGRPRTRWADVIQRDAFQQQ